MNEELSSLLVKQAKLNAEVEELRSKLKAEALRRVKELMSEHGLALGDLRTRRSVAEYPEKAAKGPKAGGKVKPKYRDPETQATWTGRGLQPKWLAAKIAAGSTLEQFAIPT